MRLNRPFGVRPYLQPRTTPPIVSFESEPPSTPGVETASATRSAAIIGAAFILSRLLGILRDVLLGHQFGVSAELDAYYAAFRIPDLVFLGVMSVAFGAAFIPVFGGFLARGDEDAAWRLASAVIELAMVMTVILCTVAFVLAGPLMRHVIAPDLPADVMPDAIQTMRILLLSPILIGLGIAAKGILEAQDLFTLPALAPGRLQRGDHLRDHRAWRRRWASRASRSARSSARPPISRCRSRAFSSPGSASCRRSRPFNVAGVDRSHAAAGSARHRPGRLSDQLHLGHGPCQPLRRRAGRRAQFRLADADAAARTDRAQHFDRDLPAHGPAL